MVIRTLLFMRIYHNAKKKRLSSVLLLQLEFSDDSNVLLIERCCEWRELTRQRKRGIVALRKIY